MRLAHLCTADGALAVPSAPPSAGPEIKNLSLSCERRTTTSTILARWCDVHVGIVRQEFDTSDEAELARLCLLMLPSGGSPQPPKRRRVHRWWLYMDMHTDTRVDTL